MSKRLNILKQSLAKKQALFDSRLKCHFASVKQANGQPLNDKRNGIATINKWDRQNEALRTLQESIETTKQAIEREESKIAAVESVALPEAIRKMLDAGELLQWRKHPNRFLLPALIAGGLFGMKKKIVAHQYLRYVPTEQYPKFRDAFNKLRREIAT